MRIGSLFSGAGGLDMAVENVFGATTAWHCELNSAASKVLAARWPDVPNLGDITEVNWANWKPLLEVDILCGGYPCQPFSAAGQRKGTDDERHLWPYFAKAIRVLRPRFVVLENVAGHRSMGFDRVLADLAEIGYDAQWCSVRASDIGAPHRRERLFVLATDADSGRCEISPQFGCDAPQSELATSQRDDVGRRGAGPVELLPTPRSSDCFGAGLHGDGGMDLRTTVSLLPTPRVTTSGSTASQTRLRQVMSGEVEETADCRLELTIAAIAAGKYEDQDVEVTTHWGKYGPAITRWESLTRPAPAPTEPNTKGNPRLSAAFSQWMMGWPAGWATAVDGISRNDALRIIGNGVVPQQATAALQWLLEVCEVAA